MRTEIILKKLDEHSKKVLELKTKYENSRNTETLDALSMNCFQTANYLIDLGEAAGRSGKNYTATYRELFEALRDKEVLDETEFKIVTTLISLRNKIAHEYHSIRSEDVLLMALYISKLPQIIRKISNEMGKPK